VVTVTKNELQGG